MNKIKQYIFATIFLIFIGFFITFIARTLNRYTPIVKIDRPNNFEQPIVVNTVPSYRLYTPQTL
jgi:hypothetical protein